MKKFILLLFTVAGFGQTVVPSGTSTQITDFKGGLKATKMFEFPSSAVSAWPGIRRAQYNESTNRLEIHNGTAYEAYAKYGDLSGFVPYTSPTSSVDLGTTYGLTGAFLGGGYGGSSTAPAPVSAKNATIPTTGNTSTVLGTFNSVGQRQIFVFVDDADVHYIGNRGAGNQASNAVYGPFAFGKNTTGGTSSFFGYEAGFSNTTGSGNTGVGYQVLKNNTTGNVITALGQYAGGDLTAGSFSTFLGRRAGYGLLTGSRNIFITTGYDDPSGVQNGSGNLIIGAPTGLSSTLTNSVVITNGVGALFVTKDGSNGNIDFSGSGITLNGTPIAGGAFVAKAGDTMTGALTINKTASAGAALVANQPDTGSGLIATWQIAGSNVATIDSAGRFRTTNGMGNLSSLSNASIVPATTGTTISRNIADANTALIVNQVNASSTGKVIDAQFGGASKMSVATNGDTVIAGKATIATTPTAGTNEAVRAVDLQFTTPSYIAVTTTYTTGTARTITANGTFTITLATTGIPDGMEYCIKNIGAGTITISGTIDGVSGATLTAGQVLIVRKTGSTFIKIN